MQLDSLDASARRTKRPHMKVPTIALRPSAPIVVTAAFQEDDEDEDEEGSEEEGGLE